MKRASIIITCYNYGQYVGAAIESALAQDYPELEVIAVDDGSTDGSSDEMARFAEKVIHIRTENGGKGAAFRAGLSRSTGDVIFPMDADDVLHRDRVSSVMRILEQDPGIGSVASPALSWRPKDGYERLESIDASLVDRKHDGRKLLLHYLRENVMHGGGSNLGFRAELIRDVEIPSHNWTDEVLLFSCLNRAPTYVLSRNLVQCRVHESNMSWLGRDPKNARKRAAAFSSSLESFSQQGFPTETLRIYRIKTWSNRLFAKELHGEKTWIDIGKLLGITLGFVLAQGPRAFTIFRRHYVYARLLPTRLAAFLRRLLGKRG